MTPGGGPVPDRKYSFSDIFAYNSVVDMQAAGWQLCGGGPAPFSQYSVDGGMLTLYNDGTTGAGVCRTDVPRNMFNWVVSVRVAWVGNSVGSLGLSFRTSLHNYLWQADGYYYRFDLQRDGQWQPPTLVAPGYTPQLNTWHILTAMMSRGTLSLQFDGVTIFTYLENGKTNLAMFGFFAQWETDDASNLITAAAL